MHKIHKIILQRQKLMDWPASVTGVFVCCVWEREGGRYVERQS